MKRQIDLVREYRIRLIAVVTGKLDVRAAVAELPPGGILGGAEESEASAVENEVAI